ncbi:MAG: hypothetical protein JXR96_28200 [Deltaproteobacteria bacterium]|nr:hypothetical protein [Deltaproteobacteria bacterium]
MKLRTATCCLAASLMLSGCQAPEALAPTPPGDGPRVVWDLDARPFPDIPFPNDLACRPDPGSPTGRRLNVSLIGTTALEMDVRAELDLLAGFSTFAPISVSFEAPLDVADLLARHGPSLDPRDDAVLLVDLESGEPVYLDIGSGAYPLTLERPGRYFPCDPRADGSNLLFETRAEDLDGDGVLDPGEDTDGDGVLDRPNTLRPNGDPVDDLLTCYERETNTLIIRPLVPLEPEHRYAVVLTDRLAGEDGQPVRSPFAGVNHTEQTRELQALLPALADLGLGVERVAFAWTFTTQPTSRDLEHLRMGLYGQGPFSRLAVDFPPETKLEVAWDDPSRLDHHPFIVPLDESWAAVRLFAEGLFGQNEISAALLASYAHIDYLVLGRTTTPMLLTGLEQAWRLDARTGEIELGREALPWLAAIPRARPELGIGPPYPVAIYVHGTGGSRMESLGFAGHMARLGIATVGLEVPMHGMVLSPEDLELYTMLMGSFNLGGLIQRLADNRTVDITGDGLPDEAGNFWSFHTFHTRDAVRQGALDVIRLIQVLRGFDGKRRWSLDADGDGVAELEGLAGDFDADGQVDLAGPDGPYYLFGISLGGIVSSVAAPLEPAVRAAAPIAPGGGMSDVALRSLQTGVPEQVVMPMLGPLLYAAPGADGQVELAFYLAESYRERSLPVLALPELRPGDLARLVDLENGESSEAPVSPEGCFRLSVACDRGDRLRLELRRQADAAPFFTAEHTDRELRWKGETFAAGSPLTALESGYGVRRQSPQLRRFIQIAQTALDPGDPINYGRYYQDAELYRDYPGTHAPTALALVLSAGDMNVPISTGVSLARAAGLLGYRPEDEDARYGLTAQQVLADSYVLEGLERLRRFAGAPWNDEREILLDPDDLSQGLDGFAAPRLDPPLRLGRSEASGRLNRLRFIYPSPRGAHGIMTSNPSKDYNIDLHVVLAVARYFRSQAREWHDETCLGAGDCAWLPEALEPP